jgi:hypothetical protein
MSIKNRITRSFSIAPYCFSIPVILMIGFLMLFVYYNLLFIDSSFFFFP